MKRFYIFKDGTMQSSTATKELAIDLIRQYQKLETHPLLRSEFSIIAGEEEFIPYGNVFDLEKVFQQEIQMGTSGTAPKQKRRSHEQSR